MREFLYFIASLATGAVLTALSVLVRPESLLWQVLLYGGSFVCFLCAIGLLIDILRKRSGAATVRETTGIRVSGRENQFINVESIGFHTGIDVTESGERNQFINVQARAEEPTSPTLPLLQVIDRISAQSPSKSRAEAILDACELLRERAHNGAVDVFGGVNWRQTLPANYDRMMRAKIPSSFWTNRQLDAVDLISGEDTRGFTCDMAGHRNADDYYGIWFDSRQIDRFWPAAI